MNGFRRWTFVWALPGMVCALWLLAGTAIFVAYRHFHELTPGVTLFGPFNAHFVRDVGLVYVTSGLVGLCGVRTASVPLCVAAALWSSLLAVFHLHVDRPGIFLGRFLSVRPALRDRAAVSRRPGLADELESTGDQPMRRRVDSPDLRRRWSRLEPDRIELPATPTVGHQLFAALASRQTVVCRYAGFSRSKDGQRAGPLPWRMRSASTGTRMSRWVSVSRRTCSSTLQPWMLLGNG